MAIIAGRLAYTVKEKDAVILYVAQQSDIHIYEDKESGNCRMEITVPSVDELMDARNSDAGQTLEYSLKIRTFDEQTGYETGTQTIADVRDTDHVVFQQEVL